MLGQMEPDKSQSTKDIKSDGKSTSTKKERQPTRNISFNLSINNYAYIKNTDRTNFNSPGQMFAEKKKKKDKEKEDKRCRTQA